MIMVKQLRNLALILLAITSTLVICEINELSSEDLLQLKEAFHDAAINLEFPTQKEDVAVCIGAPRSGKSTLINFLIGNKLIGNRVSRGRPITISKADNSLGPAIKSGSTSKTIFLSKWNSNNLDETSLWDTPGLDDDRGPIQDITNSIYLYQLVKNVRSLKIILVVDINDILNDNIKQFVSTLNSVGNMFKPKMRDYFRSISVIFTKVPSTINDVPVDIETINDLLTEKVLSSRNMSISSSSKGFVQFLIMNNQHMGLFKRPQIGPVTSDIDVNIFGAIKNSKSIEQQFLRELSPSISDRSMILLYKSREKLFSTSEFEKLHIIIRDVLDLMVNKLQDVERSSNARIRLEAANEELTNVRIEIYKALNSSLSFDQKLDILRSIDPAIETQIQEQDLVENAQLMEFVDKLLGLKKSDEFDTNLQGILLSSLAKVKESIVIIFLQLGKVTMKESQELLEREKIQHQEDQRKIAVSLLEIQQQNAERENQFSKMMSTVVQFVITKVAGKFFSGGEE